LGHYWYEIDKLITNSSENDFNSSIVKVNCFTKKNIRNSSNNYPQNIPDIQENLIQNQEKSFNENNMLLSELITSTELLPTSSSNSESIEVKFEDFAHSFFQICICQYIKNSFHSSLVILPNKSDSFFVLMRTTGGMNFISIAQYDKLIMSNHLKYSYSRVRSILAKVEGNQIIYIKGMKSEHRELSFGEINLDKGEYLIYLETDWAENRYPLFVSTYSNCFTELVKDDINRPNFLNEVYQSCALKFGTKQTFEV